MDHYENSLRNWTKFLVQADKHALREFGAAIFVNLRQLRMEPDFMDACLEYWDPAYHVFRFPIGEMYPLIEEFSTIGSLSNLIEPAVVRICLSYRSKARVYFQLSRERADDLFRADRINMLRLCQMFMARGDQAISVVYVERRRVMAFFFV